MKNEISDENALKHQKEHILTSNKSVITILLRIQKCARSNVDTNNKAHKVACLES